ncbi:MAG: RuBisCO large subunit C-terminal-like domain-containing protein [Acidimicrobiia bacterium]|nr:RuBisCO large subunit C-terminal-like domain-containing protein [Acidimicrobiia bacterium]
MSERLIVTYEIAAGAPDVDTVAEAIAVEQSVEMPLEAIGHARVLDEHVGRIASIDGRDDGTHLVRIALPAINVGAELAQFLNVVFGNSSLHDHVRLVDVEVPGGLAALFPGPRHGIEGVRRLVGAERRPLTCTALKPVGLEAGQLAELAGAFARAGIDVVKDDHGLAGQTTAPFAERLGAVQRAVQVANESTGGATRYAPSLVGGPSTLRAQAALACEAGVDVVLVAPMLVGLTVFADLVAEFPELAFLAHPAFAGAQRIAPPYLLGTLFRQLGADAVIFPNHGGRFAYAPEVCAQIGQRARAESAGIRACLPVPAGGMVVERVDEMVDFYGAEVMLLIGGALMMAGEGIEAAARAFVERVAAAVLAGPRS